jgi:hypothetical protein
MTPLGLESITITIEFGENYNELGIASKILIEWIFKSRRTAEFFAHQEENSRNRGICVTNTAENFR